MQMFLNIEFHFFDIPIRKKFDIWLGGLNDF